MGSIREEYNLITGALMHSEESDLSRGTEQLKRAQGYSVGRLRSLWVAKHTLFSSLGFTILQRAFFCEVTINTRYLEIETSKQIRITKLYIPAAFSYVATTPLFTFSRPPSQASL